MKTFESNYSSDKPNSECKPLLEACDHLVYLNNAFRIIGLPSDAKAGEIKRHIRELKSSIEMNDIESELTHAYAINPPPTLDMIRDVEQRLQDPEKRIIQELFWFWPEQWGLGRKDPGYAALAENNVDLAFQIWSNALSDSDKKVSARAKHNMAVMYHLVALDSDNNASHGKFSREQIEQIAGYWKKSLQWWFELVYDDEIFWDMFSERIRQLGDARLTTGFARRVRANIPVALDKINAHLALKYADEMDNLVMAKVHLSYLRMNENRKGRDNIDRMLALILKPMEARVNATVENVDKTPEKGLLAARELLKSTEKTLTIIDTFMGKAHMNFSYLFDKVADTCFTCAISYCNQTEDWEPCISILTSIEKIAVDESTVSKIRKNLEILKKKIKIEGGNRRFEKNNRIPVKHEYEEREKGSNKEEEKTVPWNNSWGYEHDKKPNEGGGWKEAIGCITVIAIIIIAFYSCQGLERKFQFDKLMADGKFNDALNVPGYENNETATKKRELKLEQREYAHKLELNLHKVQFDGRMSIGAEALLANNYGEALKFFEEALKIPGYENNETAIKHREQAKLNLDRKNQTELNYKNQFDRRMSEGVKALVEQKYEEALKSFEEALKIPGYENNKIATEQLEHAKLMIGRKLNVKSNNFKNQFEQRMREGSKALWAKNYEKALESFEEALKIPGYENDQTATKQREQVNKQREQVNKQREQVKLKIEYNRKNQFDQLMSEVAKALSEKKYEEALKFIEEALEIPGYENNETAVKQKEHLKCKNHFGKWMNKGEEALSADDYEEALKSFEEALKIPGYENNETATKQIEKIKLNVNRIRKNQFDRMMSEGEKALSADDYEDALNSFKKAMKISGYENNETATNRREQAKLKVEYKNQFVRMMSKGTDALNANNYEKALNSFEEALKIPGYESNSFANKQRKKATQNLDRKNQFDRMMSEGIKALTEEKYEKALNSFEEALKINGYENDYTAIKQREQAKADLLEMRRR